MITKSAQKNGKYKHMSAKKRSKNRIAQTLMYISERNKLKCAYTNLSSENAFDQIQEMENWKTLNPKITDPVEHRIFSFEKGDREPTQEEIKKIIDIFREERGLNDAPFSAFIHDDGHSDRHKIHIHLMYLKIQSDGKAVPSSWDSTVNRRVSRRVETELNFIKNAGADESKKFNGRNKRVQSERANERQNVPIENWHVDPQAVKTALGTARNERELRQLLRESGIEIRLRKRNGGEVYGWTLKHENAKTWTSASKISGTENGEFGWKKVAEALDANRLEHENNVHNIKLTKHLIPRLRLPSGGGSGEGEGVKEGIKLLNEILGAVNSIQIEHNPQPTETQQETETEAKTKTKKETEETHTVKAIARQQQQQRQAQQQQSTHSTHRPKTQRKPS